MYRIKECEKIENYCNIADYYYITTINTAVCSNITLGEECCCCGDFKVKGSPNSGRVWIDEEGYWEYKPNPCYTGFDCFEILYCDEEGANKVFKIIIYISSCKEAFKQTNIEQYVKIPCVKPDIEDIIEVFVEVDIIHTRVLKTTKGISYEGQKLTGYEVLVVGFLKQYVEYIASESSQSVHGAHFDIPFATYIALPENYCRLFPVTVHAVVEDIFYQQVDKRNIFENITLLIRGKTC